MTERLYYTDATCERFSAQVIERLHWEGHPAVVLDRTAFYPTSGGQPADTGMLNEATVVDVVEREDDGAIVHVLADATPAPDEGSAVEGQIDWERRFDHMQQHTGQHILSAAFEQLLDADTVGFHLGSTSSTIDLNLADLEPEDVKPVEEAANRVIWEDRPVDVRLVESNQVDEFPIRRAPEIEGPMRIVEITGSPSFDVNPCGGTHVSRTGEIGLVKIVSLEHRGDETRVEFLCGQRALRDYQDKNTMINRLGGMLTVGYWELDEAVERLQKEIKELHRAQRHTRQRLLDLEAAELAETAVDHGAYRVVWRILEQRSPDDLRALARKLAERPRVVALLFSTDERTHLCFARAEGLDLDVAAMLREACGALGGKGGGRPQAAQGSAPPADPDRIEAVTSQLLSHLN